MVAAARRDDGRGEVEPGEFASVWRLGGGRGLVDDETVAAQGKRPVPPRQLKEQKPRDGPRASIGRRAVKQSAKVRLR